MQNASSGRYRPPSMPKSAWIAQGEALAATAKVALVENHNSLPHKDRAGAAPCRQAW